MNRPHPLERNLALIGFMTAGKTLVGQTLSRLCGLPFVDVDALIESLEQMDVHQIFASKGEPYFRRVESAVLGQLCEGSGQIIGCGGGTVLAEENRLLLRRRCITFWLTVPMPEVLGRLENPQSPRRPLLEGQDIPEVVAALMRAREPLYQMADHAVPTEGRDPEEIAREIAWRAGLAVIGPV